MKKRILILGGTLIFVFIGIGSVGAQDPGNRDTVWIERINMNQTIVGAFGRDFAVKCSVYIDQGLAGFSIPLTFYHARNTDIFADSVKYESWVPTPDISGFNKHNSTSGDTAKTLLFGAGWFTDSLPPNRAVLCKIWFHTGKPFYTFDTTKSIVLDTCSYRQYSTPTELEFVTPLPRPAYKPVFVPGAIGYLRTISGRVSGTSLPASVFVSGDRKKRGSTDGSGDYSFVVGKGGRWIVFRDSTVGFYDFNPLLGDTSGINFSNKSDMRDVIKETTVLGDFSLSQNYPNPFNPGTVITFSLSHDSWVKIEIYDILGQKVRTLADERAKAGVKEVIWDGKNQAGVEVASGIYFYRMETDRFTDVKKMILIK